jgi:hypothetical protein
MCRMEGSCLAVLRDRSIALNSTATRVQQYNATEGEVSDHEIEGDSISNPSLVL